jgi:hypothetical protein
MLALGGLVLALAVGGCGGSDEGDGVATAGGTPSAKAAGNNAAGADQEREAMLRFSQCMRENGVPEYPDPKFEEGGGVNLSLPEGTSKEKVDAAEQKCRQYLPNGGEAKKPDPGVTEQLRAYSKCMRENGIEKFPDPTDQGLQVNNEQLGMKPDDPRLKAAEEKCRQLRPNPDDAESGTQSRSQG